MTTCKFPGCSLPTRIAYPGNEPENGSARPYCADGHSRCYGCGAAFLAIERCCERDACDECEKPSVTARKAMRMSDAGGRPGLSYACELLDHDSGHVIASTRGGDERDWFQRGEALAKRKGWKVVTK